jgi:Protein of unknown function (DUF3618)
MTQSPPRPSVGDQERIIAGIEQARQDLSDSMQALAAKVDVPARMRDTAGRAREQTRRATGAAVKRPGTVAVVAGMCAAAGLLLRRRRRRS